MKICLGLLRPTYGKVLNARSLDLNVQGMRKSGDITNSCILEAKVLEYLEYKTLRSFVEGLNVLLITLIVSICKILKYV